MKGGIKDGAIRPVANFARGFSYPFRAAGFLGDKPGLLKFLAIPFAINLLIFSLSVYFGLDLFDHLLKTYAPGTDVWYGAILYYLAWTVALLLTMILVFFSFTVIGNLVASPFNELLSERCEELRLGRLPEQAFSLSRFLGDAKFAFLTEVKKLSVFLICMLLLLAVNLLPGLGPLIYAFFAPLLTLFFLVVEYQGFVLMRKQMSFGEQRRYIFKHPLLMVGFGCGVFCLLAIPFAQFFCIPLAVVGATLLWCDFPCEQKDSD